MHSDYPMYIRCTVLSVGSNGTADMFATSSLFVCVKVHVTDDQVSN